MMVYTLIRWQSTKRNPTGIEVISSYSKKDLEAVKDILESTPIFGKTEKFTIESEDYNHISLDDAKKAQASCLSPVTSGANCFEKCIAFLTLKNILDKQWGVIDKVLEVLKSSESPTTKLHDAEYYLKKN